MCLIFFIKQLIQRLKKYCVIKDVSIYGYNLLLDFLKQFVSFTWIKRSLLLELDVCDAHDGCSGRFSVLGCLRIFSLLILSCCFIGLTCTLFSTPFFFLSLTKSPPTKCFLSLTPQSALLKKNNQNTCNIFIA